MKKLNYASPELELISFAAADIITASAFDGEDGNSDPEGAVTN
jgi:hypothetical protein